MSGKKHGKKIFLIAAATVILTAVVIVIYFAFFSANRPDPLRQGDLERLSEEEYQCVFLSMYPSDPGLEDEFAYYRGLITVRASYYFKDLKDITSFLKEDFWADHKITHLFLGLDPDKIASGTNTMEADLQAFINAYPDIQIEILLPYYSLESWCKQTTEAIDDSLEHYRSLSVSLLSYTNVKIFFLGGEEWLIANPDNYTASNQCVSDVASLILRYAYRDDTYLLTRENIEARLTALNNLILQAKEETPSHSGYSDLTVVFLGDSIIGGYTGSLSVPGVVGALSGAAVYNCGEGGTSAASDAESYLSFPLVAEALASGDLTNIPANSQAFQGLSDFWAYDHTKLLIFINYGLNDFFRGLPVASADPYDPGTYTGALRLGITALKAAYPDAGIVVMTPNYITYYGEGTKKQSEDGGCLSDYVNAAVKTAEEMNVYCLDNYTGLAINADNQAYFLVDGCHLNEAGRYLLGREIIANLDLWGP